jgi:O-antigen/teichoic acid export membrane protein
MVGSIASALIWPLGTVIISLGRMWMAFWLIVVNTVLFLGLGWVLVPRYGAAGYAAAWTCAFILSNIPCVYFLYSQLGPVMRQLKWATMLGITCALALSCWSLEGVGGHWLALAVGVTAATVFTLWRVYYGPRLANVAIRAGSLK